MSWYTETIRNMIHQIAGPEVTEKSLNDFISQALPHLEPIPLDKNIAIVLYTFHHFEKRLRIALEENAAAEQKAIEYNKTNAIKTTKEACGYIPLDDMRLKEMFIPCLLSAKKITSETAISNADFLTTNAINDMLLGINRYRRDQYQDNVIAKYRDDFNASSPEYVNKMRALRREIERHKVIYTIMDREYSVAYSNKNMTLADSLSTQLDDLETKLQDSQNQLKALIEMVKQSRDISDEQIILNKLETEHLQAISFKAESPLDKIQRNKRLAELAKYAPPAMRSMLDSLEAIEATFNKHEAEAQPSETNIKPSAALDAHTDTASNEEIRRELDAIVKHLDSLATHEIFSSNGPEQILLNSLQIALAHMLGLNPTITREHLATLNIFITRIVNHDVHNASNASGFKETIKQRFSKAFGTFASGAATPRVEEYTKLCNQLIRFAENHQLSLELDPEKARTYGYLIKPR